MHIGISNNYTQCFGVLLTTEATCDDAQTPPRCRCVSVGPRPKRGHSGWTPASRRSREQKQMGPWGAGGVEAFTYLLINLFLGRAPVASGWMVGVVLHNRETETERETEREREREKQTGGVRGLNA